VPLACLLVRRPVALAALAAVFTGWTYWLVPTDDGRELTWTPVQILLGNAYVLIGLAAGVLLCWREFSPGTFRRYVRFPTRRQRSLPVPDPGDRVSPVGDRHGS
jgi:hypothetical protein